VSRRGPAGLLVALGLLLGLLGARPEAPAQEDEAAAAAEAPLREGPIAVARVDGTINPASSDYIQRSIRRAEEMGAAMLLLELDTDPDGLDEELVAEFGDGKVGFCCAKCIPKWEELSAEEKQAKVDAAQ